MKLIEKLKWDAAVEKGYSAPMGASVDWSSAKQAEKYFYKQESFCIGFEAGFRKAREMALKTCERESAVTSWWYKLLKEIQDLGESEAE